MFKNGARVCWQRCCCYNSMLTVCEQQSIQHASFALSHSSITVAARGVSVARPVAYAGESCICPHAVHKSAHSIRRLTNMHQIVRECAIHSETRCYGNSAASLLPACLQLLFESLSLSLSSHCAACKLL